MTDKFFYDWVYKPLLIFLTLVAIFFIRWLALAVGEILKIVTFGISPNLKKRAEKRFIARAINSRNIPRWF